MLSAALFEHWRDRWRHLPRRRPDARVGDDTAGEHLGARPVLPRRARRRHGDRHL